ncbi:RNA polymerase sigma factor [Pyxidicoccus sp. 3LG]
MDPIPDGDPRHFEALIRRHHPRLRGFARKLCRRGDVDPEDLLQDTLERAVSQRAWLAAQDERRCQAWLCTTLRRRFVDLHRRQRSDEAACSGLELVEAPVVVHPPREWRAWDRVSDAELRQALEDLEPSLREPFELHAAGLRYKDISRRLGTPVGTVSSWLFKARRSLRLRLLAQQSPGLSSS